MQEEKISLIRSGLETTKVQHVYNVCSKVKRCNKTKAFYLAPKRLCCIPMISDIINALD